MTQKKTPSEPLPLAQKELCPPYCPFLQEQAFFCRLFNTQLMASPPYVFKCWDCMNSDTRKSTYKAKVKDLEKRVQMWDKAVKRKPFDLKGKVKTTLANWKDRKIFKEFLMVLAGKLPIFSDAKTCKLLLNLYLVLDGSEKQQLMDLLSNSRTAEILLNKIKTIGKSPDVLKAVRKEMDDIIFQQQKEEEEMLRQQAQQMLMSR